MNEPTVQVPVSLPTREQIELALLAVTSTEATTGYVRVDRARDAVLALLSQPTPTAVPMVPVRAVVAVMDAYDNGDGECEPEDRWRLFRDMRALLASEQVTQPAEPPRIEDMAPGVTRELDERDFPDEEDQRIQAIIDAVDDWAPNIDDMAVGTTFRAPHLNLDTDRVRLWVRTPRGLLDLTDSKTDGRYTTAAVNPSTIRDVTPPAVTS